MSSLCVLLLIPVLLDPVSLLSFYLPANSKKCLHEDIHKDVVARGEYQVTEEPDIKTNLQITDSSGHILYNMEDASKGTFAFTTEEDDTFDVCFESHSPMGTGMVLNQHITLTLKRGVGATDYGEIAKLEKLEPLELLLRRVQDTAQSMVASFAKVKKREIKMRKTNESTNRRVKYLSAFSMCCFIALATWQVLYLRRFFKRKKLID